METEDQLVAAGRGKWSQKRVPHRGWYCVETEDLGEPDLTCEMCESQVIRFVHYMENPRYSGVLRVGCICAGNMEGDLTTARKREGSMQSRANKRKRWLSRKWRISAKGNPWLKAEGYRVTVYRRGGGWAATIADDDNSTVRYSRQNFRTQDRAKLAAFDHITNLLAAD